MFVVTFGAIDFHVIIFNIRSKGWHRPQTLGGGGAEDGGAARERVR